MSPFGLILFSNDLSMFSRFGEWTWYFFPVQASMTKMKWSIRTAKTVTEEWSCSVYPCATLQKHRENVYSLFTITTNRRKAF